MGGGRSQPVNLQVRSSGQAAVTNMALSFAMSFTNQRGGLLWIFIFGS
jgi:WNK lysine deficient protein kinase